MNANYINYMRAAKKSDGTIAQYTKCIENMLNYIGKNENEIKYVDLMDYQSSISNLAPNTVRLHIAAIQSYFKFLNKIGVVKDDPSLEMERPKINPKEKPYMTASDIRAMIDNCRTIRDKAIIMFMASTGVRISEMIEITVAEYNEAVHNGKYEIKILGKGNKERIVFVNKETAQLINNYLNTRMDNCPYLFASFQGGQIHRNNLSQTLKNTAKKAGLACWEDVSNHTMRSAFATVASDNGIPVAVISKAMGHANLATTSIYIKHNQKQINNAMASMVF